MVDWLAGKRVRGTSSERTGFGLSLGGTGVGGWVEIARTTLGGAGDNIDVTGLADKRYYMYLIDALYTPGAVINGKMRFNSDSGSNYARRNSYSGGADTTLTSQTSASVQSATGNPYFGMGYVANYATKEKMALYFSIDRSTATAAYAPERDESVYKWANTSNAISSFNWFNDQSGNFDPGAEMVVLGWDPADSHTNNFWEELGSTELASPNANIDVDLSGTGTKKYIWIQCYIPGFSTSATPLFRADNGSISVSDKYAFRKSENGGADTTANTINQVQFHNTGVTTGQFINIFMINNASNEKLGIIHAVGQNTAGAGNAPTRGESVFKHTNTSSQLDYFRIYSSAGTCDTGSIMKIWGAN